MDIKDIDFSRKYTGYLWLSNAAKPIALTEPGIVDKSLFEKKNPFVAEAQLYDSEGDVSVSIRYADGRYYAAIHKAASITGDSADEVVYPGVRMGEGSPLGAPLPPRLGAEEGRCVPRDGGTLRRERGFYRIHTFKRG